MNEINHLFPKFQLFLSFFQIQSVKKEHIHNLKQKRKKLIKLLPRSQEKNMLASGFRALHGDAKSL